jgi:hypothetical protein
MIIGEHTRHQSTYTKKKDKLNACNIVRLNTFFEYEFRSLRGVLDTTLCVKFVSDLQQISGFAGTLLSSTNKADRHGITELLLKMAFNITTHNTHSMHQNT